MTDTITTADVILADGGSLRTERHEAAEYALLGLLREGPCHGYLLAAAFAPGGRLAEVMRLKMSQLYAYLHKLERQGWVHASDEDPAAARPRRRFTLTQAGERAFDAWLARPVAATRDVRLDFLLKLTFAVERDPGVARLLVAAQRDTTRVWLDHLRDRAGRMPPDAQLDPAHLTLGHRIRQSEAVLAWLNDVSVLLGA